jgi:hypothetical protein
MFAEPEIYQTTGDQCIGSLCIQAHENNGPGVTGQRGCNRQRKKIIGRNRTNIVYKRPIFIRNKALRKSLYIRRQITSSGRPDVADTLESYDEFLYMMSKKGLDAVTKYQIYDNITHSDAVDNTVYSQHIQAEMDQSHTMKTEDSSITHSCPRCLHLYTYNKLAAILTWFGALFIAIRAIKLDFLAWFWFKIMILSMSTNEFMSFIPGLIIQIAIKGRCPKFGGISFPTSSICDRYIDGGHYKSKFTNSNDSNHGSIDESNIQPDSVFYVDSFAAPTNIASSNDRRNRITNAINMAFTINDDYDFIKSLLMHAHIDKISFYGAIISADDFEHGKTNCILMPYECHIDILLDEFCDVFGSGQIMFSSWPM